MLDSGFLEFKLNYAQAKYLAIGEFVKSEDFSAGGHQWRVRCYPRGWKVDGNNEHLSIYLELVNKSKNVKAILDVFMMDKDGVPSTSHAHRFVRVHPPIGYSGWGFSQFVKRSDLESLYLANGWITIAFGVIVVRNDPLTVPASDIGSHLGAFLDCNLGTDVSFVVGSETFPARRAVLAARSPVFKAELFGPMADTTMQSITLQEIEPAAFNIMLRFMYTDALPTDDELGDSPVEMMQHLLAAADRYGLDRLKLMCANKLWENVSADTVASVLACAETYNIPELKSKCIDFFTAEKNFKKTAFTSGFAMLISKLPTLVDELRRKVGV
ncbi:hypothetical protein ACP70R_000489 [Stipagrostis hirtigluma subsp. patula]